MKFSFWNQYFSYAHESELSPSMALEEIRTYYQEAGAKLVEDEESFFRVEKGLFIMSLIALGPETWLKHFVTVSSSSLSCGKTRVLFDINLKVLGLTVGKNYLVAEAKKACLSL